MHLSPLNEGSLKELWRLSFPLMLTSLSYVSMLFTDRWLLASYSTEAFNAASISATTGWIFVLAILFIAGISEVFVAQNNGAGRTQELGQPVWQMIWLALFSFAFYLPLGIFAPPYLLTKTIEQDYFRYMMFFGPAVALTGALSGFFVGQGKIFLVCIATILANIVNACLDIALIFGIEGWFEPLGMKGAAIATSSSAVFQSAVLAIFFLTKKNRTTYGTFLWRFSPSLFWQCLKVGLPGALFISVEISGWALFYNMMAAVGEKHLTIAGIFQSFCILFYFFGEGMGRAAAALAGNLIGAKKKDSIFKLIRSGALLHVLFFSLLILLLFTIGETITSHFLPRSELRDSIAESLPTCLSLLLLYLFFEGLRLLIAGILTAAGDTLFLLAAGSLSIWFFLILPVYLFIVRQEGSIELACFLSVFYAASATVFYLFRFKKGKWQKIELLDA